MAEAEQNGAAGKKAEVGAKGVGAGGPVVPSAADHLTPDHQAWRGHDHSGQPQQLPHPRQPQETDTPPGSLDALQQYLTEIRRIPRLSEAQEQDLGAIIQKGLAEDALPEAVQAGQEAAKQLAQSNLSVVVAIALHRSWSSIPLLDLIQEGNIGLLRAAGRFDPTRGTRFRTYATWWIRQAMQEHSHKTGHMVYVPDGEQRVLRKVQQLREQLEGEGIPSTPDALAQRLGVSAEEAKRLLYELETFLLTPHLSLDTVIESGSDTHPTAATLAGLLEAPTAEEEMQQVLDRLVLEELLQHLTPRERQAIALRFGLDGKGTRTLKEVGWALGLRGARVSQLEHSALNRLRRGQKGS